MNRNINGEVISLFFIGDNFYRDSQTSMSSIYTVSGRQRYDWEFVQRDLRDGKQVNIRQATEAEMVWIHAKFNVILQEND